MVIEQIIDDQQALTELVDAEINQTCQNCGGNLEVVKTSTGTEALVCGKCDYQSEWAY